MKIILEQNEINYIQEILISLPIKELDKVQQILTFLQQKQKTEEIEETDSI